MAYDIGTARGIIELEYNGRGIKEAQDDLGKFEESGKRAGVSADQVGRTAGRAGVAIAAALGAGVMAAANFEQRMSAIKAVSGATSSEMDRVSAKALQLGKDTAFSASESAMAMEELIKAGLSVDEVLNGAADATVALAAAGEIDLPQAATIASNAMNQFNLSAKDMPKVADAIAGAANASAIDVSEFGQSLQQVGAVANLAGIDFKDTATAIALMGNAGIKGSDAGTSLKSMFMRLQPTTKKQSELFKELGLITADGSNKFYDQEGNLKSLAQVSGILQGSLKGMTKEQKQATLQTLFGSDAIRAAAILSKEGAKGFEEMAQSMGKVTAAEVAAERLDNFKGSLEQLKGSLETAGIVIGTVLLPALRSVVDAVTAAFNWFLNLSEAQQKLVVAGLAAASGLLLMVAGIIKLVSFVKTLMATLSALKVAFTTTWLAALGPIALVVAAVAAIGIGLVLLYKKSETFRNFVNAMWASIKDAAASVAAWFQGTLVPIMTSIWNSIKAAAASFMSWWSTAWGMIKEIAISVWRIIAPAVMAAWNLIKAAVQAGVNVVVAIMKGAWGIIVAVVTTVWNVIKAVVEGAIKVIANIILAVLSVLRGDWTAAWEYLKAALTAAWNAMVAIVKAVLSGLKAVIAAAWNAIKGITSAVWDGIKGILKAAWNAIKAAMTSAWNALVAITKSVWNGIKQFLTAFWNAIKSMFTSALNGIKSALTSAWNAIKSATTSAWNSIKSAIQSAWNAIKSAVQSAASAVRSAISNAWDAVKSLTQSAWNAIKNAVQNGISNMMSIIRAVPGQIRSALSGLGSLLISAGSDLVRGLINGIRSMASSAIGAVTDVVGGAVSKAKSLLGIGSPSKVFYEFGKWLNEGFIDGVKEGRKAVGESFAPVIEALRKHSDAALRSLIVSSRAKLMDLAKEYGRIESQLEKAVDRVKSLKNEADQLRSSVLQSIKDTGNLGNIKPGTDEEGNQLPLTYEAIKGALEGAKAQASEFYNVLSQLKRAGLDKDAIQQLITAGPEEGLAAAKVILAQGDAAIQQINGLQAALTGAGKQVAALAADNMYKAAIDSAQAVVRGLQGKRERVRNEALQIGLAMGRGIRQGLANMEGEVARQAQEMAERAMATIRRALRMRSPSRVMMDAGEDAGKGFAIGLANMMRVVEDASAFLAHAAVPATPSVGVIPAAIPIDVGANGSSPTPNFDVKVFLGDTELKDMVRVEITDTLQPLSRIVRQGAV